MPTKETGLDEIYHAEWFRIFIGLCEPISSSSPAEFQKWKSRESQHERSSMKSQKMDYILDYDIFTSVPIYRHTIKIVVNGTELEVKRSKSLGTDYCRRWNGFVRTVWFHRKQIIFTILQNSRWQVGCLGSCSRCVYNSLEKASIIRSTERQAN